MMNNQGSPGALSYQPAPNVHGRGAAVAMHTSIAPVAASVPPMASTGDLDRELEMLALGVRQKRRSRLFFVTSLLMAAALAASVSFFTGKVKEAEAAQAEAVAARIAEQDRIAQLNLQIQERDRKISVLTTELDTAKSEAAKAQKAVADYKAAEEARSAAEGEDGEEAAAATAKPGAKAAQVKPARAVPGKAARSARAATSSKKGGKCECKQGDPLCGCL